MWALVEDGSVIEVYSRPNLLYLIMYVIHQICLHYIQNLKRNKLVFIMSS